MVYQTPSAFDPARAAQVSRRNLPHWRQDAAIYFVTFRLADSLPAEKLHAWRAERDQWLARNPRPHSPAQVAEYRAHWEERIDAWLDASHGGCALRDVTVQTIVENAMRFFDTKRYRLGEFVVMPNHVHALVMPMGGRDLSCILHSWKSFTANQINHRLGRVGTLWQDESFDHIIRDDESLATTIRYIRENGKHLPPTDFRVGCGSLT